ncbi:MAG: M23 family metallopeptidase [Myxococcales bacterium]|nr:MAG: M23 family metallopeptidase [Myxococcales bacterium]
MKWPVSKGWFVRGFGSGEGGYHQAVDIMGKIGWNVRAAAPGIVAYSGKEVRGYGNMVLVVHPGGWATMYAHNSVNFVVAGEKVARGAVLAEVGSTGISRGPHVHFELIYKGQNCDPLSLFRPEVRHRNGKHSQTKKSVWKTPGKKPKTIRCNSRKRHPRSRWVTQENPEEGESSP